MMPRQGLWIVLPAAFVLTLFPQVEAGGHDVSITTHIDDDGPVTRCDQIEIRAGDGEVARAEDPPIRIPSSSASALDVVASRLGGIYVTGGGAAEFTVRACKAAVAATEERARRLLEKVAVRREGNRVVSEGPEEETWLVYLLVEAPEGSSMKLRALNGPIGVRGVSGVVTIDTTNGPIDVVESSGRFDIHASNGPISVKGCRGEVVAEARNGPIDLTGGGGRLVLDAENGPISVELTGGRWDGEGLEARTTNGPLSLKLPDRYESGVRVETSWHSPISCLAEACERARKTWDDQLRLLEFGTGDAVVRLSTRNGPVSVKEATAGARHLRIRREEAPPARSSVRFSL